MPYEIVVLVSAIVLAVAFKAAQDFVDLNESDADFIGYIALAVGLAIWFLGYLKVTPTSLEFLGVFLFESACLGIVLAVKLPGRTPETNRLKSEFDYGICALEQSLAELCRWGFSSPEKALYSVKSRLQEILVLRKKLESAISEAKESTSHVDYCAMNRWLLSHPLLDPRGYSFVASVKAFVTPRLEAYLERFKWTLDLTSESLRDKSIAVFSKTKQTKRASTAPEDEDSSEPDDYNPSDDLWATFMAGLIAYTNLPHQEEHFVENSKKFFATLFKHKMQIESAQKLVEQMLAYCAHLETPLNT